MKDYNGYYLSTAWIWIRGAWLFDFITCVFTYVLEFREMTLTQCAISAYDETLKDKHPWILQRAAKIGMLATTSREKMLRTIGTEQESINRTSYTEDQLYRDFT